MTDTQALIERLMQLAGNTGKMTHGPEGPITASDVLRQAATALTEAEAKLAKAREALSWFLTDEQFVVTVGGNPNVVEQMLYTACACLAELREG